VVIGLALVAALGLPACRDLNSDLALSEGVTLEALSPDRTTPAYPLISRVVTDGPSLQPSTMDRSHWTTRRIVVPVSGVEHRPIYATGPTYADETPRQAGQFPTIYSALDLGTTESAWNEGFEAMAWPFWAGLDIALMPARAAVQPPWTTVESPLTRYQRAPEGTASPAMLDDPAAPPVPGVNVAPTVPSTAYPRWIWRNGNWYLWQPGDPEPWYVPQRQPDVKGAAPAADGRAAEPPKPRPRWFFRDGRWVRDEAVPPLAPAKPQEPKP
jgi:hypothetical protein